MTPIEIAGVHRCVAHGNPACKLCSRNPSTCMQPGVTPGCEVYAETGMHWDTCPNRIRGPITDRHTLGAFELMGPGLHYVHLDRATVSFISGEYFPQPTRPDRDVLMAYLRYALDRLAEGTDHDT